MSVRSFVLIILLIYFSSDDNKFGLYFYTSGCAIDMHFIADEANGKRLMTELNLMHA